MIDDIIMGLYTIIGPYWSPLISGDLMHDCNTYWLRNSMVWKIVGLHLPAIDNHHGSEVALLPAPVCSQIAASLAKSSSFEPVLWLSASSASQRWGSARLARAQA